VSLQVTPALKKALSELYFREGCDQKGWAFVPVAGKIRIADNNNNIIEFAKGAANIRIKVPAQMIPEVTGTVVFDYLVCQVGQKEKYDNPVVANPLALCWVKMGKALLQPHLDALEKAKIPLAVFTIRDVLAPPGQIQIKWDIRSAKEWLDDLDDKRDEAESDDDYF
jgi:hypothetical protein